jgi:hypothetical protein
MRFGLEQPRYLLRKRGFSWTNLLEYGKIPMLKSGTKYIHAQLYSEGLEINGSYV